MAIITLTPCVPLSLKGEGGDNNKRGASPLLDTPYGERGNVN